jgi:hypothetical protein
LALSAEVDSLTQNPGRFLWSVKAGRVLRFNEVKVELSFPLEVASRRELRIRNSRFSCGLYVPDQIHQGIHGNVPQAEGSLLNDFDTGL